MFALFAIYYVSAHRETVPLSGRTQIVDVSQQEEVALGLQSYRAILSKSSVVPQGVQVDLIRSVGKRIAAVSERPDFEWEFNLINSEQANAFALPGGKVAVYTGLLPITQNPDGLAAVIGHEVAHAIARHGAERMTQQRLMQMGQIAVGMSTGDLDPQTQRIVLGAFGLGSQFGVLLPFSRKHESEADYIGLLLMAKACFDPREAPKVWVRMQQANSGSKPPEFLSTHPSTTRRIQELSERLPEALKIFSSNCAQ